MPPVLFLLFNHRLTDEQKSDARDTYGVKDFQVPPPELAALWAHVPPQPAALKDYLEPFRGWLKGSARPGDLLLVQGDFGATYLMVNYAFRLGLRPVYATTRREANERTNADGTVEITHRFRHCRFRTYGQ